MVGVSAIKLAPCFAVSLSPFSRTPSEVIPFLSWWGFQIGVLPPRDPRPISRESHGSNEQHPDDHGCIIHKHRIPWGKPDALGQLTQLEEERRASFTPRDGIAELYDGANAHQYKPDKRADYSGKSPHHPAQKPKDLD